MIQAAAAAAAAAGASAAAALCQLIMQTDGRSANCECVCASSRRFEASRGSSRGGGQVTQLIRNFVYRARRTQSSWAERGAVKLLAAAAAEGRASASDRERGLWAARQNYWPDTQAQAHEAQQTKSMGLVGVVLFADR